MKVSVVIPTKNAGAVFKKVLESVLAQEVDFDFEVIIIDSGSSDQTLAVVEEAQKTSKNLRLVQIPSENFAHGRTRNEAISKGTGEFIAMITHDAIPANLDWLRELVMCIEQDSQIAGVFGRHEVNDVSEIFTARDFVAHFSRFEKQPVVWNSDPDEYLANESLRQFLHFFSDNNALLRRSVWEQIPYPDVNYAEDQMWAKLVIEAGWKKAYAHNAIVRHSHRYSIPDTFRRSFDESKALKELFGYKLGGQKLDVLKSWVFQTLVDTKYAIASRQIQRGISDLSTMPLRNLMRPLGHYLGARASELSPKVLKLISYDFRLRVGLRRGTQ